MTEYSAMFKHIKLKIHMKTETKHTNKLKTNKANNNKINMINKNILTSMENTDKQNIITLSKSKQNILTLAEKSTKKYSNTGRK